jgi:hypothetical protein
MGRVKLSGHQRDVLKRMATGDEVWTIAGVYASCFWHLHSSDQSPGTATVEALRSRGLISHYERDFSGSKYRITDSGRAHLSSGKTGE